MAAWATTYLGDKGVSEGLGSTLLSGFWLAFMASRLIAAGALKDAPETVWALCVLGLAVACIAVWAGVVLSRSRPLAGILVVLTGFIYGPIFPTVLALLMGTVSPSLRGRAVGLFFAIGGIGWTGIPILIGIRAKEKGVQGGFLFALAAAVGLCAVSIALYLVVKS